MTSQDSKFKFAMKGGRRSALMRLCRSLYATGKHDPNIKTVKGMVSILANRQMGQRAAWIWLLDQHESGVRAPLPKKVLGKAQPAFVASKSFYGSDSWRAIRFEALKAGNGCCTLCGRSNRLHGVVLHVDHIKPKSHYPELALELSNLQILCEDCNLGKSNRDDTDWRTATDIDRELDRTDWKAV